MAKNKPRIHITINSARALRPSPPNKKEFDWDDEVRGFGAYRTSDGVVVFVYQYRLPHQPARRAKIGELGELTPSQARDIARRWAVERRNGIDPVEQRRAAAREREAERDLTMKAYVEAYVKRRIAEERPINRQHARILVDDVAGLMSDVRIDKMTTTDIDVWLAELQKRSKSARIYGLIYLKVILNDAKARGKIAISPADAYKTPPRTERERVLRLDEIQRVMEALADMGDRHSDVIECLMRTMRRKEEVAGMSWEEIDQTTWVWTIPAARTKTKTRYVMDLPRQVITMLERQQPDMMKRTGWVFTRRRQRNPSSGEGDRARKSLSGPTARRGPQRDGDTRGRNAGAACRRDATGDA